MSLPSETKAEAVLQLRYNIRCHELHRRLYRRVQLSMSFASIAAGSAALLPVWQQMPGGLLISGIAVAVIGALGALSGLPEAAARRDTACRDLNRVLAGVSAPDVTKEQIDAAITASPHEDHIEALRYVAWHDVLRSGGYLDGIKPETRWQRVMRAVA